MLKKNKIIYINLNDIKSLGRNQFHIFFKRCIFDGYIIIFKSNPYISKICRWIRNDVIEKLSRNIFYGNFEDIREKIVQNKKLEKYQEEFKRYKLMKKYFKFFLNSIGLRTNKIFLDQICFRFSSPKSMRNLGTLQKALAHRDTWGSNMREQINWWFPIKNIFDSNSLYVVPEYFNKFINNTSDKWSYFKYKKNPQKYASTPFVKDLKIIENKRIIIKPRIGDIVCFSGHHVHGSGSGESIRLNIETRSISLGDCLNFKTPKNLDYFGENKKPKWFKNIESNQCLSSYYK